jgi:hypothetical protein
MRNGLLVYYLAASLIGCGGGGDSGGGGTGQVSAACANARAVIASGGALSATQQQQVQAYSARLSQEAENRGGVGLNQVAAQVASYTQSLVQANLSAAISTIAQSC